MRFTSQNTYELLKAADAPPFEELYHIYERSLPPRERKSRAEILAAVTRPDYQILLAKRSSIVGGFSIHLEPTGRPTAVNRSRSCPGRPGAQFKR